MKLCKNCTYFRADDRDRWDFARCAAPQNPNRGPNPVTGDIIPGLIFCDSIRKLNDLCGPDASWFEPARDAL
jgi:hypothetical protein